MLVALDCDPQENARRLVSPGRAELGKLQDTEILDGFRRTDELMRPSVEHRLDLDTTEMSAEKTAQTLLDLLIERGLT